MAEFLGFELSGLPWKSTRVRISDLGAIREAIRRERRQCAMGADPSVQGVLMAQPISEAELWEYMLGAAGSAMILYNCVSRANQTFTEEMAERMVLEGHEFVQRLFVESRVLNPTLPDNSSATSSPPESSPARPEP